MTNSYLLTWLNFALLGSFGSSFGLSYFSRRDALASLATSVPTVLISSSSSVLLLDDGNKKLNLSDEELKSIIQSDLQKDFLVSADITRDIYDEAATFTDEIDTYTMDKWIKGTKALFVAEKSKLDIVGEVNVSKDQVDFRFREDLMFRIPFRPICSLSGKVILLRDTNTGLITSYREYWDQDVATVLKTAKFNI